MTLEIWKACHRNAFIAGELLTPKIGREGDIFGNWYKIHQVDQLCPPLHFWNLSTVCQESDFTKHCIHLISLQSQPSCSCAAVQSLSLVWLPNSHINIKRAWAAEESAGRKRENGACHFKNGIRHAGLVCSLISISQSYRFYYICKTTSMWLHNLLKACI